MTGIKGIRGRLNAFPLFCFYVEQANNYQNKVFRLLCGCLKRIIFANKKAMIYSRQDLDKADESVNKVPFISNMHAEGGMLYGSQVDMPSVPLEEYGQAMQDGTQEPFKQWDDLSLAEKNAFIATAVKHGMTNMDDIRKAYSELAQGNEVNDLASQGNESQPYNDDGSSVEQDTANVFLKGGYKPSKYIRNFISHMEGSSMKTNRSFDAEAKDFWNAMPQDIRKKITQQQADALYSYSYNVGAGNFKRRVIPALQAYFNGNGSMGNVQRSMWASKDKQLRGLANRRAQERAMFAGSEMPVYYGDEGNESAYAPQYSNPWRNSRLGPVTSINMSRGLGAIDSNAKDNILLGPVSNMKANGMTQEAINTLYDDAPQSSIAPVPQEELSSLDRFNAIQDYLSSLSPFGYANGGRMNAKLGVVSSNGQYHVSPSDYDAVLGNASSGQPLEVTLPDTTVTASAPRNYRSYYDQNGAEDFLDATTLGLFPNPFKLSRSASTFIQHPSGVSAWDTAKDALMFAGGAGYDKAFAPLGLMNLADKEGVRKTYGLIKDGNYAGAAMSGLGDVLNAGMVAGFLPTRTKVTRVKQNILQDFGSAKDGNFKFSGFVEDPVQMHIKRAKAKGYDTSGINIYNLSESTPENKAFINELAQQYAMSPEKTLDFLVKHLNTHGHGAAFKGTKNIIHDGKAINQNAIISHEIDHVLHIPKEPLPDNVFYPRIKNIYGNEFIKDNNTEVAARGSQLHDYFGHTGKEPLTKEDLLYARSNYSKDTGIDNDMSDMLWSTKNLDTLADWMTKYSTAIIPVGLISTNHKSK